MQPLQTQLPASLRRTRQRTKQLATLASESRAAPALTGADMTGGERVTKLLEQLPASITRLRRKDHQLLLRKQVHLRACDVLIPRDFRIHSTAIHASLVFAQEEAGTAVCVAPEGLLLTCSHCIAETEDELDYEQLHWLLFADGRIVRAKCVAWDAQRDLALLRITSAQTPYVDNRAIAHTGGPIQGFPFVRLADAPPPLGSRLICIGHPGSEDLENEQPGVKTNYEVLHLSTGVFRGYADGQDPQDNSEIGALMHDCWTYWGHSGAPILDRRSGKLIGLHSSWDDQTAMRRGVTLEAIQAFLLPQRTGTDTDYVS